MTKELDSSSVSRRAFLAKASGVVAVGQLVMKCSGKATSLGGPTPTPTDWVVTVTPDYTTTPPTLQYNSVPAVLDPSNLPVQPGDTVQWIAKTKHSQNHLTVLFVGETPFVHKNGDSVFAFHGSHSDTVGKDASILTSAQDGDSWEYYVGVWDDDGSATVATATGDPTIIIGRGMVGAASARAKSIAARRLLEKAEKDYPGEDANKLKSIVGELTKLIDKWGKLLTQKK